MIPLFWFAAQRCQCLGDFSFQNYSINALDMYCRNKTWETLPSGYDGNMQPIKIVVPDKTRCGSLDPLEMDLDKSCSCWQTNGEGACKF